MKRLISAMLCLMFILTAPAHSVSFRHPFDASNDQRNRNKRGLSMVSRHDFTQPIPHFTTFGKNYARHFRDTDIFESIFARVLEEAMKHGFVEPDTHVKVGANKNKYVKELVHETKQEISRAA